MKNIFFLAFFAFTFVCVTAQPTRTIPVSDNLVSEGLPPLPYSIVEEVKPYTESRGAGLVDIHPVNKQILINTRFGNSGQIHQVKMPGGDRKQLTFFDESPRAVSLQPVHGQYFLFSKDIGGNEFTQIYRYDYSTGKSMMITDGSKVQNGNITWNKKGTKIIYTTTRRNGTDRDIYTMDPLNPATDKRLLELKGGGWSIGDWSEDEKLVLLNNSVSINESSVWIYDMASGTNKKFLPENNDRVVFGGIEFSKDNRSVYVLTNQNSEFLRPARVDINSKKINYLTSNINWEIQNYQITKDEKMALFVVNEAGVSKMYIQDLASGNYKPVSAIPVGVIGTASWFPDNRSLAFSFTTSSSSSDVYEWNTVTQKLTRWTESELGGMNLSGIEAPQLVKWKSFDGLEISGFLYKANKKFSGKRPVIINIHGGPEGQSFPTFLGRSNYFLNELGVSIILPNVRGSTGYGKTFTDMDNGLKREESVKDIGALLDWIGLNPELDASRIMITGGSYGGYMTLAAAFHYNDKIKCALDIVGISNFNTFLKNTESYRRDLRRVEYGDERDSTLSSFFERTAPLNNAHKITKPMFIVQGKNDPRVPYTEALQMVEKIRNNGGKVWYLMANDEGHGFAKKNNQDFQFYATVAFVKEYLLK
ncbi:MAG: prolyl oligopeptidase family serine peptidase [Ferruginibacter sp.]